MTEDATEIAGLTTRLVHAGGERTAVVMLHGYSMKSGDLSAFGRALRLPALYLFPQGPLTAEAGNSSPAGHAWWPVDLLAKRRALRTGARDLAESRPDGLAAAEARLSAFLQEVRIRFKPHRLLLGGFSQGAMLACHWTLHRSSDIDALILLSSSRIDIKGWQPRAGLLRGLPVFISHGHQDIDLAFSAGERLRDFALSAGAQVTWTPFDGGHEIPLVVWRALRRFLTPFVDSKS